MINRSSKFRLKSTGFDHGLSVCCVDNDLNEKFDRNPTFRTVYLIFETDFEKSRIRLGTTLKKYDPRYGVGNTFFTSNIIPTHKYV